jgi:hypothetical protein
MRRGSSLGGLSNSKVANELFASASSAKVHHVPVYSKLGVTAAVAAALLSLLLPVEIAARRSDLRAPVRGQGHDDLA